MICKDYLSERAASDPAFHFTPVMFGADNPQCASNPEIQALAAKFALYRGLISGILASIVAPKIGAASDRYGRKKLIAFTTTGMLAVEIIRILTASYPATFSVNWILFGSALDGLCGSFISAMAVSNAYTADCTEPSKRAVMFGYFQACLFTGIAVGPILAGYIVAASGKLVTIFWVALGAQLFFLCFLLVAVPESLTKDRQLAARQKKDHVGAGEEFSLTFANSMRRFSQVATFRQSSTGSDNGSSSWSWSSPLRSLCRGVYGIFTPLSVLWPTGPSSSHAVRRNLVFLAAVDTTMFGVAMGSVTVVIYYAKYKFAWGNFESQRFLSIVNTCRVTVLLVLLPLISRLVRGPRSRFTQRNSGSDGLDLAVIRVAIAFDIIGYAGYSLSQRGAMLTLSGAIASVGGMGSPTLQSSLTKHVPPDRVGQLLGAMGLLHALARVVAPTIFNLIYATTVVKGFPQAVFLCLTATFGVAFLLSWFIRPHGMSFRLRSGLLSCYHNCLLPITFTLAYYQCNAFQLSDHDAARIVARFLTLS